MNEAVIAKLKQYALESHQILNRFSKAIENSDYTSASNEALALTEFFKIDMSYNSFTEFEEQLHKGTLNWDM